MADCSENGIPEIAPNCGAFCRCFGGWEGEFCEIISARGGGDPHLETLDGKCILHLKVAGSRQALYDSQRNPLSNVNTQVYVTLLYDRIPLHVFKL